MGDVLYIPFQSIQRLEQLREDPSQLEFMDSFITDVLVPGLRSHMKQRDPVLRVYVINIDEHPTTVDVHLQLKAKDGEPQQPWVFSFTSDPDNEHVTLEAMTRPFPLEPIFWECEYFDKEEVVKACEGWSERFWPDFDATFKYGYVERLLWDWDELFSELFPNKDCQQWSVVPREEVTSKLEEDLEAFGSVMSTEDEVVITTTKSDRLITMLSKDWPQLSLMPADHSGHD